MKHNNIAIFIPHQGCKNECSFCNQKAISGQSLPPTKEDVFDILTKASEQIENKTTTEIAFFGGSFTAIDKNYMLDLLETANKFVGENKFYGIRVSTRPDAISEEILDILKSYNVTSIELGAQSMDDFVLKSNNRGHSAKEVYEASSLIKKSGIQLGLQMMVGLYNDNIDGAFFTASEIIRIKPDTVRIYPTVILKNTKLEKLYTSGEYKTIELEQAVLICARLLEMFSENGVKVIKLGLHASVDVERDMVGGIYHPAFKELCEGEIFFKKALRKMEQLHSENIEIYTSKTNISKMVGHKKRNIDRFSSLGYNVRVLVDETIGDDRITVENCNAK